MFFRRSRVYQDIDAESGVLPEEPELVQGRIGMEEGLGIVLLVEWVLIVLQIIVSIVICADMDVFTGLLTIGVIAVGIWAISRLNQARKEEDPNMLTPYCAWKAVLLTFESFGLIILLITAFVGANSGAAIFSLISDIIFISVGVCFLTFIMKCRVYFQLKDRVTNPVRGAGDNVVYNPHYVYGQFYNNNNDSVTPGAAARATGTTPAPPGYVQATERAAEVTAPPVYKEKENGTTGRVGTEMTTVRAASTVTDDDL